MVYDRQLQMVMDREALVGAELQEGRRRRRQSVCSLPLHNQQMLDGMMVGKKKTTNEQNRKPQGNLKDNAMASCIISSYAHFQPMEKDFPQCWPWDRAAPE